jgi:hypothetical protein
MASSFGPASCSDRPALVNLHHHPTTAQGFYNYFPKQGQHTIDRLIVLPKAVVGRSSSHCISHNRKQG